MTAPQLDIAAAGGLALLDVLSSPVWLADAGGGIVWLNRAGIDFLDLPDAAAARHVRLRCPHPDAGRGEGTLVFQRAGRDTALTVDGTAVAVDGAACGRAGETLWLVEAPPDTAAKQDVIRLTEQLIALSYAYPDMRFELRRDGSILDFAAASPADLNVPAERFLEARVQDVLPEPASALIDAALGRVTAGETVVGVDFSLPDPGGGAGGERFFEARLVALYDGQRIMCSVRNVTDRVLAEREVLRMQERLIDAIESITDGFVLYDADDRLVLCNSKYRDLFDISREMAQPGRPFSDVLRAGVEHGLYVMPPQQDTEAWIAERIARHNAPGEPFELELSDGRWVRVQERRTSEGGVVGVRTDITDLKRREAQLRAARDEAERANAGKSDYVHHLSHELRTPLNAVMGFAQIVADEMMGPLGNPRYRDYAGQIAAAGAYMLNLINNLLDLAKIEAGRMPLNEEMCDLHLLVDMTFSMLHARAAERGVRLESDLPDSLPPLLADVSQLRQMLTNLVGNGIKFARPPAAVPEGPMVRIDVGMDDAGTLTVTVRDNGIGMAPEAVPRALDAFGQVHDRTVSSDRGSGLGLPLTRALVELHGGRFAIDSAPGVGTEIRLTFPRDRVMG
ncbi:signal transduction histidine kinase [Azospirillum fermentarium]|uniref:sensor histidine kinase n=1 Tax=Azospirillum fermentarium TaxID=1233114 RepID=UPI0022271D99|nr:PAS-domain containing protein [Azospirillum fermentarium]MCW2245184.1 signal transduction histidine kinase [Azospirillum fermentarium]